MKYLNKINEYLVYSLIIFLPWHSLFISGYLTDFIGPINLWKDFALILFFLISFFLSQFRYASYQLVYLTLVFVIAFVYSMLFIADPSVVSLYGFRYNTIHLLAFAAGLIYPFKAKVLENVLKLLGISAVLSLGFGLYQAYVLGPEILLNAGYPAGENSARPLKFSFYISGQDIQRVSGAYSGPLSFSFYMFFVFALYVMVMKAGLWVRIVRWATIAGLLFGFSRAFLGAALVYYITRNNKAILKSSYVVPFVFVLTAVVLYIGVVMEVRYITMAYHHLLNTITMEDRSLIGHFESFDESMTLITDNWLRGVGLGTVGPHAVQYIDSPYVPESSLFAIWIEGGVFALLSTGLLYIVLAVKNRSNFISHFLGALFLVMLFLPLQYYTEVTIQIGVVLGMYIRYSEGKKYIRRVEQA